MILFDDKSHMFFVNFGSTQMIGISLGVVIGFILWRVQIVCQRSDSLVSQAHIDRFTTLQDSMLQESTPQDSVLQQSTIQNIEMYAV